MESNSEFISYPREKAEAIEMELVELKRKVRRNSLMIKIERKNDLLRFNPYLSRFYTGLYGELWINTDDIELETTNIDIISNNEELNKLFANIKEEIKENKIKTDATLDSCKSVLKEIDDKRNEINKIKQETDEKIRKFNTFIEEENKSRLFGPNLKRFKI